MKKRESKTENGKKKRKGRGSERNMKGRRKNSAEIKGGKGGTGTKPLKDRMTSLLPGRCTRKMWCPADERRKTLPEIPLGIERQKKEGLLACQMFLYIYRVRSKS